MLINLPKPKNWQDFESLCHKLWRSIWNDSNTQKNGRTGQPQNGVDIFGMPYLSTKYHGVQCKGKNDNYDSMLTDEEIMKESEKAISFTPELESFIIASTAPRNAKLQQTCRNINAEKTRPFNVDVWAWDDIEEEVQCRQELMDLFYPTIKQDDIPNKVILDRLTFDRLAAFFTRPNIKANISPDFITLLYQLSYELIDNSFKYGEAKSCTLSINDGVIQFSDNGVPFDPLSLLESGGNGGYHTLKHFKDIFQEKIDYYYHRDTDINIFELKVNNIILSHSFSDSIEITIHGTEAFGRGSAEHEAVRIFSPIPQENKHIVLNITSDLPLAMSYGHAFFCKAVDLLQEGQDITVYVPNDLFYFDHLTSLFVDKPIKFIQRMPT